MLNENNSSLLRKLLNTDMCKLDSDTLLKKCLVEPIDSLLQSHQHTFNLNYMFVIIDGLDECASSGNQLSAFLVKHVSMLPKWLKLLVTTRDADKWLVDRLKTSCHVISLDPVKTTTTTTTTASSTASPSTNGGGPFNYSQLQRSSNHSFNDSSSSSEHSRLFGFVSLKNLLFELTVNRDLY